VLQVNRVRPSVWSDWIGVRKGTASAVIDVSTPHTDGWKSLGKSSPTARCRVGSRTARWNH
jgi:hypothetical protein